MTKSHKLLPQSTVFPGKSWGFSALTSGLLMSYHSAAEQGTQRFRLMCQRMTHHFHRQLRTQVQETSGVSISQIWSSIRSPQVLAWKSRGVCLADVAGVYGEARPLESQHLLQGQLVLSVCREEGSVCIPSIGLQNTQVSEPTHLPKRADSKF